MNEDLESQQQPLIITLRKDPFHLNIRRVIIVLIILQIVAEIVLIEVTKSAEPVNVGYLAFQVAMGTLLLYIWDPTTGEYANGDNWLVGYSYVELAFITIVIILSYTIEGILTNTFWSNYKWISLGFLIVRISLGQWARKIYLVPN